MKASVPPPQEMPVFEIQAYMDLTKHIGSLQATDKLARLCQIGPGKYVLDVGCGVGATPAYLVAWGLASRVYQTLGIRR